jgi:hypothetical protein
MLRFSLVFGPLQSKFSGTCDLRFSTTMRTMVRLAVEF